MLSKDEVRARDERKPYNVLGAGLNSGVRHEEQKPHPILSHAN